jgi:voltage-gated potassium channel
MSIEDGIKFQNYLETHEMERHALDNLYAITNNTHSHLISGPDKSTFEKLLKELEKMEEIIGVNLSNKEIAEMTNREIKE